MQVHTDQNIVWWKFKFYQLIERVSKERIEKYNNERPKTNFSVNSWDLGADLKSGGADSKKL